MVQLVRHRQTKESATDRLHLNHRVTPRLHKHGYWNVFVNFQWCASSKIRHSPAFPCHSEAMYAVSFGNCLRWMGCDGSAICWRTAFQNSNLSFTAIQFNFVPQLATMNCTVPVCMSSRMRLWSRCRTRPPCNVPFSSQSSVSGNFVTIRWSGFNTSAFRPSSRIYHDLVQAPG